MRLLFFLATLAALVVFLLQPEAASWVGFVSSLPHWPARVLRWLLIGRVIDPIAVSSADWALHAIGGRPWVHSAVLIFVAWILVGFIRKDTHPIVLLVACLLGFPIISAFLSGMHLSRGYNSIYSTTAHHESPKRIFSDLVMGMEPLAEDGPPRALRRIAYISGDSSLLQSIPTDDPTLVELKRQIEEGL